MTSTPSLKSLACALALAAVAPAGHAATVTVSFDNPIFGLTSDTPNSDAIRLWYPKPLAPSGTMTTQLDVLAGRFTGVATASVGFDVNQLVDLDASPAMRFAMYCYDLDQTISGGASVVYSVDLDGESQRTRNFIGAVNAHLNSGKAQADPHAWLRPGSAMAGAAIQIGLWESLYDKNALWSVDANQSGARGAFYAQNLEASTAVFLSNVFARLNDPMPSYTAVTPASVIVLRSSTRQDMITGDPPSGVPSPATAALVALAGMALVGVRRRRCRAH